MQLSNATAPTVLMRINVFEMVIRRRDFTRCDGLLGVNVRGVSEQMRGSTLLTGIELLALLVRASDCSSSL
jgi:hypothetical protein